MKKFILDLIVKENKTLNSQYFLLILTSKEQLPEMLPGQFVEVRVDNAPTTFLRRPISIIMLIIIGMNFGFWCKS